MSRPQALPVKASGHVPSSASAAVGEVEVLQPAEGSISTVRFARGDQKASVWLAPTRYGVLGKYHMPFGSGEGGEG